MSVTIHIWLPKNYWDVFGRRYGHVALEMPRPGVGSIPDEVWYISWGNNTANPYGCFYSKTDDKGYYSSSRYDYYTCELAVSLDEAKMRQKLQDFIGARYYTQPKIDPETMVDLKGDRLNYAIPYRDAAADSQNINFKLLYCCGLRQHNCTSLTLALLEAGGLAATLNAKRMRYFFISSIASILAVCLSSLFSVLLLWNLHEKKMGGDKIFVLGFSMFLWVTVLLSSCFAGCNKRCCSPNVERRVTMIVDGYVVISCVALLTILVNLARFEHYPPAKFTGVFIVIELAIFFMLLAVRSMLMINSVSLNFLVRPQGLYKMVGFYQLARQTEHPGQGEGDVPLAALGASLLRAG